MDSSVNDYIVKARKNVHIADHMAHVTYNLFDEPKLLLAIMENLFLGISSMMNAVLMRELEKKRVPSYADNFEDKFIVFKERCAPHYKVSNAQLNLVREISDIVLSHRKSPVEFVRKDRFVICNKDYKMKTLSINNIKDYISKTKSLISHIEEVL
jgi:hypothetical protein